MPAVLGRHGDEFCCGAAAVLWRCGDGHALVHESRWAPNVMFRLGLGSCTMITTHMITTTLITLTTSNNSSCTCTDTSSVCTRALAPSAHREVRLRWRSSRASGGDQVKLMCASAAVGSC